MPANVCLGDDRHDSPHAPPAVQPVVDGAKHESRVGPIKEALHQSEQEPPPGKPLEGGEQLFEELMHVQALRRDKAIDHANDE
jgi:hypothetical protein